MKTRGSEGSFLASAAVKAVANMETDAYGRNWMAGEVKGTNCNWLCTGQEVFPAMLREIEAARVSVLLETYTYGTGALGQKFREALIQAQKRGVIVKVLIDALGSYGLPAEYWALLTQAGGQVKIFN